MVKRMLADVKALVEMKKEMVATADEMWDVEHRHQYTMRLEPNGTFDEQLDSDQLDLRICTVRSASLLEIFAEVEAVGSVEECLSCRTSPRRCRTTPPPTTSARMNGRRRTRSEKIVHARERHV